MAMSIEEKLEIVARIKAGTFTAEDKAALLVKIRGEAPPKIDSVMDKKFAPEEIKTDTPASSSKFSSPIGNLKEGMHPKPTPRQPGVFKQILAPGLAAKEAAGTAGFLDEALGALEPLGVGTRALGAVAPITRGKVRDAETGVERTQTMKEAFLDTEGGLTRPLRDGVDQSNLPKFAKVGANLALSAVEPGGGFSGMRKPLAAVADKAGDAGIFVGELAQKAKFGIDKADIKRGVKPEKIFEYGLNKKSVEEADDFINQKATETGDAIEKLLSSKHETVDLVNPIRAVGSKLMNHRFRTEHLSNIEKYDRAFVETAQRWHQHFGGGGRVQRNTGVPDFQDVDGSKALPAGAAPDTKQLPNLAKQLPNNAPKQIQWAGGKLPTVPETKNLPGPVKGPNKALTFKESPYLTRAKKFGFIVDDSKAAKGPGLNIDAKSHPFLEVSVLDANYLKRDQGAGGAFTHLRGSAKADPDADIKEEVANWFFKELKKHVDEIGSDELKKLNQTFSDLIPIHQAVKSRIPQNAASQDLQRSMERPRTMLYAGAQVANKLVGSPIGNAAHATGGVLKGVGESLEAGRHIPLLQRMGTKAAIVGTPKEAAREEKKKKP